MLTLVATLSSCAALDVAKSFLGSKAQDGLSIDAQIGDRENELQAGGARGTGKIVAKGDAKVTVTTSQADARVDNAETVIVKNYDPWMLWGLLTAIVLFVPSPLGYLKRLFKWRQITPPQT